MSEKDFRERLQNGETVVGTLQLLDSAMVSEMIGVAGMDFVVYDQEHGPLGAETTLKLSAAAQNRDVAPIVRCRANDEAEIQRALDIGTAGVQVPQVETRADAKRAVEAARFDPIGSRGLSQYVRAGDYWGSDTYTKDQNESVLLVVQVEGKRGIENIEEILTVEGIDIVFLGPYDLSQSLGIPGQITHERVEEMMTKVCELADKTDTVVGTFADSPEIANKWIDAGVQDIALGVEVGLFTEHLASLTDAVDTDRE